MQDPLVDLEAPAETAAEPPSDVTAIVSSSLVFEELPPLLRSHLTAGRSVTLTGGQQENALEAAFEVHPAEASQNGTIAKSGKRFRSLVENSSDMMTLVEADTTIRFLTASVERVLGYQPQELLGLKLANFIHPEDTARVLSFFADTGQRPGVSAAAEWRMKHRDSSWIYVETVANNLLHDPDVAQIVLNTRDISERKALETQLAHQAFHDPLTDLANRALFHDRVEHALVSRRTGNEPFAVLFLDLDDFKKVNDSLGHVVGDELLAIVARRIRSCVRASDTPARLGGDEFAILLENAHAPEDARAVAEAIIDALQAPVSLQGNETFVGTSVGIAMSRPDDGADELLRNADIAMYMAKGSGKGRAAVFEPTMHAVALERLELESDLRRAVQRNEFLLFYQPLTNLRTGRIVGVEALARWNHPERGILSPYAFISMAEETGLILPLGKWILEEACNQISEWHRQYPQDPALMMSVNLSGKQLLQPALVDELSSALSESGLDPKSLILEITESVMMYDTNQTVERLSALKQLGVKLAIDDFGTGYSSLRYLHRFPVDILKIASPFIEGVAVDVQKSAFTRTIIELCRTLQLTALAEGVESAEQVEQLRRLGCELGQGNYFAEPLTSEQVEAILREGYELAAYAAELKTTDKVREAGWWEQVLGKN
ncbi:MAG: EAL domain-containing protein [Actinobacteria bacterium]|nr:EAL domain-containing protein [Actinomycetota bacterium]